MSEASELVEEQTDSPLDMSDADFDALDEHTYYADEETPPIEESVEGLDEEATEGQEESGEETEEELLEDEQEESEEESESEKETEEEVDYKSQVEQILAPFKANGKEIQVDNVEDALNLMKMGANYNKKMAALKPSLKLLKTLENNGLLDENKLNYLIDLDKRNPDAIKKLIKESEVDLDDFSQEDEVEYSPSDHAASDNQIELDTVLERIQDTPTYQRTVEVITNEWDASSKKELAQTPQLIETINSHIDLGVYDRVVAQVAKEQALGRLTNLSDFQAYSEVGAQMMQEGKLSDIVPNGNQSQKPIPAKQTSSVPPKQAAKEADRVKRKLATKPAKTGKAKPKEDFNPLGMSDDEFEKIALSKYL